MRISGQCDPWPDISRRINLSAKAYWFASFNRQKGSPFTVSHRWEPPPAGWMKFNADAAIRGDHTWSACILRDHLGQAVGAWVSKHYGSDVFSAELKALLLAFHAGEDLQSPKLIFEGDALGVIQALHGNKAHEDWRSSPLVDAGRKLVSLWPYWSIKYVPRQLNSVAHNLANWVARSDFSGYVNPHLLPHSVMQAMNDSVVNLEVAPDVNDDDG